MHACMYVCMHFLIKKIVVFQKIKTYIYIIYIIYVYMYTFHF